MEAGESRYSEWETSIRQYLLAYAGYMNESTGSLVTFSLNYCISFSGEERLNCLKKAKQQFKEASLQKG
jgi:hypothetical protein